MSYIEKRVPVRECPAPVHTLPSHLAQLADETHSTGGQLGVLVRVEEGSQHSQQASPAPCPTLHKGLLQWGQGLPLLLPQKALQERENGLQDLYLLLAPGVVPAGEGQGEG